MSVRIERDPFLGEHVVIVHLTADEAEGVADALGQQDRGGRELREAAAEARELDRSVPDWDLS